ncbi:MAG: 50S ribosomal protein L20 [Chloroflexota bacterium]
MSRIKRGVTTHRRHKKWVELAKGHRAGSHSLFALAHESMMHALYYAYSHRRERKGDMRRLWVSRVNAASRLNGLNYNQLIEGLKKADITLNRKLLADLAVREPAAFAQVAALAKAKLEG